MLFDFPLKAAELNEKALFYSGDNAILPRIGHVRADFGSNGVEFWHSWFPGDASALNTAEFRAELHVLVESLRVDLLSSRDGMRQYLRVHPGLFLEDSYTRVIGYRMRTQKYVYYIRCAPSRGNYDCYIYCYALRTFGVIFTRCGYAQVRAKDEQEALSIANRDCSHDDVSWDDDWNSTDAQPEEDENES